MHPQGSIKIRFGLISILYALCISVLGAATVAKRMDIEAFELMGEMMGDVIKFQKIKIDGCPNDKNAEGRWYLKLAGQGNAAAQNNLGVKYATGDGVPKNYPAALRWLNEAAGQNSAAAEFTLGLIYADADDSHTINDVNLSAKWFQRSADHGCAIAQYWVYLIMSGGRGLPKNEPEALNYLRKAADQMVPAAELLLGGLYKNGNGGVAVDKKEAAKWIQKAADHNLPFAYLELGEMYEKGEGVAQDNAESLKWLRKSVSQDSPYGQCGLAKAYAEGRLGLPKDDAASFKYYLLAANQALEIASYEVGEAYALGRGVEKNEQEAIRWLRKRSDADVSLVTLGNKFATGDGVVKNGDEAVRWYRAAAEVGNALSPLEKIAELYIAGDSVSRNYSEALKWYRLAAIRGSQIAQNTVGEMHARGEGTPKDEIEALAWFYVSAAGNTPYPQAPQNRDSMEQRLGREMTIIAQQRSKEIFKEIEANKSSATSPTPPETSPKLSGTGSIISLHGHILTAAHVVASASKISVVTSNGTHAANVLRIDESNDLAVLKIEGEDYTPLAITSSGPIRLGQMVATIGFPNIQIQGFSPKLTRGEINSLNGIGDDPRSWQISAPIQPGNSGGPLLDESGNLIGVVVSKLGLKVTQVTGDIPQNVNYAVKSAYAMPLLEPYLDNKTPQASSVGQRLNFEDMVAKAQQSVVLILVY